MRRSAVGGRGRVAGQSVERGTECVGRNIGVRNVRVSD